MKSIRLYNIFLFFVMTVVAGCTDDLDFEEGIIGDGESVVSACIEYEPNVSVLDGSSRAAGNAISEIKQLAVVIYKPDKTLYKIYNNHELKLTHSINIKKPEDYTPDMSVAEDTTARVSFNLPEPLPFGRYYMYVVANLGQDITEAMASSPDVLKSQSVEWKFGDVTKNAQMFGYVTPDDNRSTFGEAPLLVVNKSNTALHSWIKRLASKVTVAFDGAGLHQNIWVYVHNVSIRQIPLSCKLGDPNKPTSADEISTDGYESTASISREQFLVYNDTAVVATDRYPNEDQYKHWLIVANGNGIQGSAKHTKNDPALYFYENLQGDFKDDPNKEWFNKEQKADSVGTNVTPGMKDYKDNVPLGTFIEVEAYYVSNNTQNISNGPIKYRFMLGQNETYNYDAIRNRHYKVTLGFKGFANQPDWHIEYIEETPEVFVPEVYVPYLYNQSVEYPLRFKGNLLSLDMEIIENNWAPYDPSSPDEVPPEHIGSDDFENRVLEFNWNRNVFMNSTAYTQACPSASLMASDATYSSNYLYGRHNSGYVHLEGIKKGQPYYVTPIWVGFLRLMQPSAYESESTHLPMAIFANNSSWFYYNPRENNGDRNDVRGGMKRYYEGTGGLKIGNDEWMNNGVNLGKRSFKASDLTAGPHGAGRNSYTVERSSINGENTTTVNVKLWTQPKTMGFISGFSGNNPYEFYQRKAVIRFTAKFSIRVGEHDEEKTIVKDIPVYQDKRIINPKGVWRSSSDDKSFNFVLLERNQAASATFTAVKSKGEWTAKIATPTSGISLSPLGNSRNSSRIPGAIEGDTESEIRFKVNFSGQSKDCAVVEVRYHGNTSLHKFFVRQGYDEPIELVNGGAKWSSYAVYSFDKNTAFGKQTGTVNAKLTVNPLALGTMFKKGNYAQGIRVKNVSKYPVRTAPGRNSLFDLINSTDSTTATWADIYGIARARNINASGIPASSTNVNTTINGTNYDAYTWHWAKIKGENFSGVVKNYRVPTYNDFKALYDNTDVGVGVLYGDGATEPQYTTKEAFGFLDSYNGKTSATQGIRGFFCYNSTNGNNLFFPVGTTGMGRRTMQNLQTPWEDWAGVLRYSAVPSLLTQSNNSVNQFRPIPYNMPSVPGVIYWLYREHQVGSSIYNRYPGWDMNFFDMNFNEYDYAMSIGPYGDAVPIKLVLDE